jgi:simple sugar transport system substrate-binding protein
MSKFGPTTNLTSITQNWGNFYIKVVNEVLADKWKPESVMGSLSDGIIKLAPLNSAIPAEVRNQVETLTKEIASGQRQIFTGPLVDQQGTTRVPAGQHISPDDLANMNYLVQGVDGLMPKN